MFNSISPDERRLLLMKISERLSKKLRDGEITSMQYICRRHILNIVMKGIREHV